MSSRAPLVLRADELAAAVEGALVSGRPDVVVAGFSIDSRRIMPGDLFVAIRGKHFDGHAFTTEAVRKGASGMIISDSSAAPVGAEGDVKPLVIVVRNTIRALQLLGRYVRRASGARVVAVTGSIGKTTTKEITATLLALRYHVFRSTGNLNNHIGLPLSLLELRNRPDIAVVELGMNHAGEIRTLVQIAEPEIRVWTNVAEAHSALFDSIDAIADAKAEVLENATSETDLVVNAADPRVMTRAAGFPGRVTTFGLEVEAVIGASGVRSLGLDGMEATVRTPVGSGTLRTPLLGPGNVANVLAAIAVAFRFQVPLGAMLTAVAALEPQPRRGKVVRLRDVTLVDDSYNSNPTALRLTLEAVGRESRGARRVAVLGEMLELGPGAPALHAACGRAAVAAGFEFVIAVGGPSARALADGTRAAGLPASAVVTCATSTEAADVAQQHVRAGDLVLIKGSRGIGMEVVVDRLKTALA